MISKTKKKSNTSIPSPGKKTGVYRPSIEKQVFDKRVKNNGKIKH